jgi:hypothetical protein
MLACIAEVIQRDILRAQGKGKTTMNQLDWNQYLNTKPALKACLDIHCARMGDFGFALSSIYKTLSGRIHGGRGAEELELSRNYIVVSQDWLTHEQVLCVACLLTHHNYDFKLQPPIPGFGIEDEED